MRVHAEKRVIGENMRPPHAAAYLGVSKNFLDQARVRGNGPAFVKVSPTMVIYRRCDLDAWLASRVVRSTIEAEKLLTTSGSKRVSP